MKRSLRVAAVLLAVFLTASIPATGGCTDSTSGCCKVCRQGKACGDTCIAKNEQCTKGAGCACDG